jgi:hypothetical protein
MMYLNAVLRSKEAAEELAAHLNGDDAEWTYRAVPHTDAPTRYVVEVRDETGEKLGEL